MKSGIPFITLTIIFGLIFLPGGIRAEAAEIWNSTDLTGLSDSTGPAIHGMTLVWQARGGLQNTQSDQDDYEIFICDLATLEIQQVTDDDSDDTLPQTDGDFVVWQKYVRGDGSRIYLFDIYGGDTGGSMISLGDRDGYAPVIARGRAVWTSQRITASYEAGEIMLYNAAEATGPRVISDTGEDCSDPRLSEDFAVWMQQTPEGALQQWKYNLDTGSLAPAPRRLAFDRNPASDSGYAVLTRRDSSDSEILLYSRAVGNSRITDNDTDDRQPVMSQNHAAWVADGAIHVADLAEFMKVTGLHSCRVRSREFTACWKPIFSDGVDEYRLDISTRPDFSLFVPGYHDRSAGNRTSYRIRGLRPDTTYYFRIRAVVNGSTTLDSTVADVTTRKSHKSHLPFFWNGGSANDDSAASDSGARSISLAASFLQTLMDFLRNWLHSFR